MSSSLAGAKMDARGREDPVEMVAGLCGLEVRAVILWPGRCRAAAAMASERFPQAGSPSSHLFRMRASVLKEEGGTLRRAQPGLLTPEPDLQNFLASARSWASRLSEPIFPELGLCAWSSLTCSEVNGVWCTQVGGQPAVFIPRF